MEETIEELVSNILDICSEEMLVPSAENHVLYEKIKELLTETFTVK